MENKLMKNSYWISEVWFHPVYHLSTTKRLGTMISGVRDREIMISIVLSHAVVRGHHEKSMLRCSKGDVSNGFQSHLTPRVVIFASYPATSDESTPEHPRLGLSWQRTRQFRHSNEVQTGL